jgi:RNA polymerase sigma factor (TIGR02999 family)
MSDVTRILSRIEQGDGQAAEALLPLVYEELRRLAAQKMAQENPGHTLQATALVHEAYIRLVDVEEVQHWDSRRHFFAAAAEAMRRILIETARRKRSDKYGGNRQKLQVAEGDALCVSDPEHWLALNDALTQLSAREPDTAELAKLRIFAGLSVGDAAAAVGMSRATAYRHWTYARAWLLAEIQSDE